MCSRKYRERWERGRRRGERKRGRERGRKEGGKENAMTQKQIQALFDLMQQNCAVFTRPTLSCHSRILARLDPLKNLCMSNPEGPLEKVAIWKKKRKKERESGNLRTNPGLCIAGWGWVLVSGIFLLLHPISSLNPSP